MSTEEQTTTDRATPSQPALLVHVGLPVLIALSGLFHVRDLDVWWRVRTGEWIWATKSIPDHDPFSFTADGGWNCVEPLGNLVLYVFHALFGQVGLSWAGAFMVLIAAALTTALARYSAGPGARTGAVVLAVGLFASIASFRFGPKPEQFTLAGLASLLLLLHYVDRTKRERLLIAIVPLVVLWALLHRGSTVAIPVVGAAMVVWAVRRETRGMAAWALGALAVTVAAIEVLPGMSGFFSTSTSVVSSSVYTEYIGEWRALSWQDVRSTMPLLPVLAALWLAVAPRARMLHFGTLVVVGLSFMAVRHSRFVPLAALAMVPEVAWGLSRLIERHHERIVAHVRSEILSVLMIATSIGAIAWSYLDRPQGLWGPGVSHKLRPVGAAAFLEQNPPPGRMFNTFNYGSYLLYALGPLQKVFIDGRNDQVYSEKLFAKAAVTPGNPRALAELVTEYDISYAVLQHTQLESRSYLWLYRNPHWHLVYMDDNTAIMVANRPETQAYLQAHAYRELRPDSAITRAEDPHGDPRREAFERDVFRLVEQVPNSIRAHYLAGLVHKGAGRFEAYEAERAEVERLALRLDLAVRLPPASP